MVFQLTPSRRRKFDRFAHKFPPGWGLATLAISPNSFTPNISPNSFTCGITGEFIVVGASPHTPLKFEFPASRFQNFPAIKQVSLCPNVYVSTCLIFKLQKFLAQNPIATPPNFFSFFACSQNILSETNIKRRLQKPFEKTITILIVVY